MNLIITLNPANLFWFLPGGKCHLSSDAPGPIHVDFLSLTKDEQKCIILAGRSKTIDLSIHDAELVEVFNGSAVAAPVPVPTAAPALPSSNRVELEEEMSSILSRSNSSIKREIGLLDDPKSVKILLELEVAGSNRFKIVECIQSRLSYLEELIALDISNNTDENAKVDSVDPIVDNMEVVDSEVEIREIPLDSDK